VSILADVFSNCEPATVVWQLTESLIFMFFASVTLTPSTTALPGGAVLQQIADGIASWSLIACLIALVLGAGVWAIGAHFQNSNQSLAGRRAVVTAIGAAVLIGAAPQLINFFFSTGLSVK
jgi:hypothetical protein